MVYRDLICIFFSKTMDNTVKKLLKPRKEAVVDKCVLLSTTASFFLFDIRYIIIYAITFTGFKNAILYNIFGNAIILWQLFLSRKER